MLSPLFLRALYSRHSSGRWLRGSHWCCALRNENTRSLARDFSSSRRAPPKARSKPWMSSACLRPAVFQRSVCAAPWSNGLIPARSASGLRCTISSSPHSRAMRSRSSYIARNFHVVSTCSSGNGGREGKNALRARCSSTELSLPIEYSSTGRSDSATASRRMSMLSASRRCRWVRTAMRAQVRDETASVRAACMPGVGSGRGEDWPVGAGGGANAACVTLSMGWRGICFACNGVPGGPQ